MAESQSPFPYTPLNARCLEAQLSSRRFFTYLKKAGHNQAYAFELYLYNARLAKAFLFPLHIVEIVLRNGVDEILCSAYGERWPMDSAFLALLTTQSQTTLSKAKARASKQGTIQKDDVVSRLTFDFWSNLFRAEYDRSLWQTNIKRLFPEKPDITRASLQQLVYQINQLRNRIAHHEPIFGRDISGSYKQIIEVVSYRCKTSEAWLRSHSTVHQVLRSKPSAERRALQISVPYDRDIAVLNEEPGAPGFTDPSSCEARYLIIVDQDGTPKGVIDKATLMPK